MPHRLLLGVVMLALSASAASGANRPPSNIENRIAAGEDIFEKTPHVAMLSRFWEKVFQRYGDQQVLIHDVDYPEVIVDVIDFQRLAKKLGVVDLTRAQKDHYIQRYFKRYELALKRFEDDQLDAIKEGAMEERIYEVYSRNDAALSGLLEGSARLRTQLGLANQFIRAANTAQSYIPDMEEIFKGENVPTRVTRLAFVESMFNTAARSKVGASGIWQLMPGTARRFMNVNHYVDERNAPLKATRAAARLLAANYRELGSWPLAITAYNHGTAGMARAQKWVGGPDLDQVIQKFQSPSFGFASKNFYAEFLAAASTYDLLQHQGKIAAQPNRSQLSYVALPRPMSLTQVVKAINIPSDIVRRYNPCLLPTAFTSYKNRALPERYAIALPKALAQKATLALYGHRTNRSIADAKVIR